MNTEEYLNQEVNVLGIYPDFNKSISFALAYPDFYRNGLPNLGIQALYREVNRRDDAYAVRAYLVDRAEGCHTLEDTKPLGDHDLVGFSFSFEGVYSNFLEMMACSNIPAFSKDRGEGFPLIIGGGPCVSYNPEPLADFLDAIVIGEGEEVVHEVLDCYSIHRSGRSALLEALSRIDGVYVPSMGLKKVQKRSFDRFSERPAHSLFVTPNTIYNEPVFSIELSRGCSNFCKFCEYGHTSGKQRNISLEDAVALVEKGTRFAGRIKLFYEAIKKGDYLAEFFRAIDRVLPKDIGLSLGAFTQNQVTEDIIRIAAKRGQGHITVAPEAPEGFLRGFIGKGGITDEGILETVRMSSDAGIPRFGLYLMNGFPYEREEDLEAYVDLIRRVRNKMDKSRNPSGLLEVHINPFFPKPGTPLERLGMDKPAVSLEKIEKISRGLRDDFNVFVDFLSKTIVGAGNGEGDEFQIAIKTIAGDVMQYSQPVLARGNRCVSKVLYSAWEKGNTVKAWESALSDAGIEDKYYNELDEPLPWDFLKC